MEFENAIERIKADKSLKEEFVKNPKDVLSQMNVDLSNVVFGKEAEAKMEDEVPKDGISACVSVGYYVCFSVGFD